MTPPVLIVDNFRAVALQGLTGPVVIGGLAVLVIAVLVAVVVLGKGLPYGEATGDVAADHQSQTGETDPARTTSGVDEAALSRLEEIVPDAVSAVRGQADEADWSSPEERLYSAIDTRIDDGALDMSVVSVYGEQYEIVNLPSDLRETDLTQFSGKYHVQEIERVVRDWIAADDVSLRDISIALTEIIEHKALVSDHIQSRESEFEQLVAEITDSLDDVTAIAEQIDGQVGSRFRMLVVENRHQQVTGVTGIETGVDEAKAALHRCAFDDATRQLQDCKQDAETLLTAVDFFRSLIGGIEHGQKSAQIPNDTAKHLCLQLKDLLEQQHDIELTQEDGRIVVDGFTVKSESQHSEQTTPETTAAGESTDSIGDIRRVQPSEITDEILYILRDLKQQEPTANAIEIQTEQLPDSVSQPAILQELTAFCQRRSDIVDEVTLQEGAPPGFLEICFIEGSYQTQ